MINLLLNVLSLAGIFCTLIGMVTVVHWKCKPKHPSDESNRINNIASWWIGLTRPDVMAHCYKMFTQDVMDSVKEIGKNEDFDRKRKKFKKYENNA